MRKRLVWAVMAMCLLAIGAVQADAQTELDQARASVAATTERLEGLLADLETAQRRGDELTAEFWQVESQLALLDSQIGSAAESLAGLDVERNGLRDQVRDIAVEQYMTGTQEFSVGDHAKEADRAAAETLAQIVVGSDNQTLDQLTAVAEEYEIVRSDLETRRAEQLVLFEAVQATQAELLGELERLTGLRVELDQELIELESALADLEQAEADRQAAAEERARIAEERRRAEAAAAAAAAQARAVPTPAPTPTPQIVPTATAVPTPAPTPPPEPTVPNPQPGEPLTPETGPTATATVPNPQPSQPFPTATATVPNPQPSVPIVPSGGGILCPVNGAFTHTDDFNAPRAVGGVHRANDLIAATGTPVIAVASGTIEHRESRVGGLSAHLKADNGDYYFYTHLSGYENVGAGRVAAGTVIGYVGMTGNAPIPHLHFEIHRGGYGNYANPYGPVRAACF